MSARVGERRRIAVFVDVQNIYYTTKQQYRRHFDYRAWWNDLWDDGDVIHAFAYAVERDDPGQRKFQAILRDIGFTVKLKPFIQRRDGSAKGDWDVGITLDVYEHAGDVDLVVIASGDGDFAPLVERIKKRFGVLVRVTSVTSLTADALIAASDEHQPIDGSRLINR